MKKILASGLTRNEPSSQPEKFKVHIISKQCSDDDDFFCKDGEKCGEWKCPIARSEFSQCVLELSRPELAHFNPNQKVKRSCQCHSNTMGFRLFTGCKWKSDNFEPRTTTTTTTTTTTAPMTTSTTTSPSTATITTSSTKATTERENSRDLLFDIELEEFEENEEDQNLPQISSDHEEIFIVEFASCGREIPALARLTCNMFSSSRACSVTCPNIFETNSCECHNGHCFWEQPFNRACFERQKGLSSFEIRGAAHPETRERPSFPVFDAPSKTTEDGVYVQAFDLFQQMQRMMYESGYFNIFVN
ncbi:unnamed protein product [Oikopleura dioica]|uniref:Uncharacterized protein n=1 Tax=Oikopleura dioica TaxID=34765 RepID=E4YAY0_OIKDI|nr:unnamed protein product [Oikopleura dioica]